MLIVVGGANDAEARAAVAHLGPERAALLDANDLSRPGWRLLSRDPGGGQVVASGRVTPAPAIAGVVIRRLAVYPQELAHVHADDRAYVAAEMTATLAGWLSTATFPVLNRPGAGVLCGPGWRREQWLVAAAAAGIPAAGARRSTRAVAVGAASGTRTDQRLCVVGDAVIGTASPSTRERCLALARAARVSFLSVALDEHGAVVDASGLPPLTPEVVEAVARQVGLA
ncbi:MAG: hypothetical protein ABUS79_09840 [Pseudomonadota bacterium]